MKSFNKYFIVISLLFLIFALYKADYLKVPRIYDPKEFLYSFVFLFFGFVCNAIQWKAILKVQNYQISIKDSITSFGLSIFGKYIPGKVWTHFGKGAYISGKYNYPFKTITEVSFYGQLISIWVGLTLGFIGLIFIGGLHLWSWLVFLIWFVLSLAIFTRFFQAIFEKLVFKLLKKKITLLHFKITSFFTFIPWFILTFVFFTIGFYFLVAGLILDKIPFIVGFTFPFAMSLGTLAIVLPGGLGLREGIIVSYLLLFSLPLKTIITLSLSSRLWFLIGEMFIFFIAFILKKIIRGTGKMNQYG